MKHRSDCVGVAAVLALAGSASATSVAVIDGSFYTPDAANFLAGLPGVSVTTLSDYDANALSGYDFVLHYGNGAYHQADLETYINGGGTLIALPWMANNNGWQNSPASPLDTNGIQGHFSDPLNATVVDPNDPYLAGVSFNNGDLVGWEALLTVKGGVTVPATHADGSPLLAYMDYGAGRSIYLDLHYITSDCSRAIDYGWGQQLLANIVGVPTPGAASLLGVAGLTALRRRR